MKTRDTDNLLVDIVRAPTLVFTSRGSSQGNQNQGETTWAKKHAKLRSSFEVDMPLNIETSGNRTQSTAMNVNSTTGLPSEDASVHVSSDVPNTSEADESLRKHAFPLTNPQVANVPAGKRKSLTFSRTASLSIPASSLNRRYSYDVNPALPTKPPPLIPAPKSFLHRKFSLSTSKHKDELHLPLSHYNLNSSNSTNITENILSDVLQPSTSPPLHPPSPPSYKREVKDTNVPYSKVQQPSFLEPAKGTHTNQHSQTSPALTSPSTPSTPSLPSHPSSSQTSPSSFPHPQFRFPPPPHSPPPSSPTPPDELPTSNISTFTTSSILVSSHCNDDTANERSALPSEISEFIEHSITDHTIEHSITDHTIEHSTTDHTIEHSTTDHTFPASSCQDSVDTRDASPSFYFNTISDEQMPEAFTSNSTLTKDTNGSTKETEVSVFVTSVASLQHSQLPVPTIPQTVTSNSSKNMESVDKVNHFEDAVEKISHHSNLSDRTSSFDDVVIGEPKLPDKLKEPPTRKQSLSPKKVVEVLKLQPDKTIRQQIKPGLVGELANLFQNIGDEQDISTGSGVSYTTTEHTVRTQEGWQTNKKQQAVQSTINNSVHVLYTEVFHGNERENIDIIIASNSGWPSSDRVEETLPKPNLDIAFDSENKPGVNYLTASKEMLKRVTESRSHAETDTLKKYSHVDKQETHYFGMEDNIVFPSMLDSSTPNKMEQIIRHEDENSNKHGYLNNIRREAMEVDEKFRENTADLNSLRHKTADTLTKSTNSDNQEFYNQVDLNIMKSSKGAAQEREHVILVEGSVPVTTDMSDFNKDDKEKSSWHTLSTANRIETVSTKVKEMSTDHDQSVSKFEHRANTAQHEEVGVTESQFPVVTTGRNDGVDNELNPISDNYERNVAVNNPYRSRPLSHVISNTESLLTTPRTENINSFININKGQPFTLVTNYNTLDETLGAKTGSENTLQTNQGSLRSKFSLSTQTFSKSQSNSDYSDRGFDNTTSHTSQENSMVGPTADTSSNHGVVVTDDGADLDFSSVSRSGCSFSDENDGVKLIKTDARVINTSHKNDDNHEDEVSEGVQERLTRDSLLTVNLTPTVSRVGVYVHKQTVDESSRPSASSDQAFVSGSNEELRRTDSVDVSSKRLTDQVSDNDLFVKFPESITKSQKSDRIADAVEVNDKELNTDNSVTQNSDDFLSILEEITIPTDITSGFLRSSRRGDIYSTEKNHEHKDQINHLADTLENQTQELTSEQVMKAGGNKILNESSTTYDSSEGRFVEVDREVHEGEDIEFDHSLPASTEMTAFLSARDHTDLNEEIEKQHDVLSPRLSEPAEFKKILHQENNSTRSHRSSVSSTTGSQIGHASSASHETMFNSDFFSTSETIPEKFHQTSLHVGSLKKAPDNTYSHDEDLQNTLNSYTTVDNLNEHEGISKSEWITPVDISRLIPWSDYEANCQIPFIDSSDDSKKEPADLTNHRNSISSTFVDDKEQKKATDSAVNKDVFKKRQITDNTTERRLSQQEPLITASNAFRSIPWSEYADKLKVDPDEHTEFVRSNSQVEHSQHVLLQQELTKAISPRRLSQDLNDLVDDNLTQAGKEIYKETHKPNDIQYSEDTPESGFSVTSIDDSYQTNDNNNNTLNTAATPTIESSSVSQLTSHPPHVISNENNETTEQKKEDEIHMSKNKFQNLKSVFEKQDFENHPKPTAGFLVKRDSYKFNTNRSPPTRGVSRAKYDQNEGMSSQVGGKVTSQHETGVYVSRDIDQSSVDVHVTREKERTEIDTAERRDSQCTDTSDEPADRGLVDTRGTRATIKKSQQTSLAEDVQTGELLRHSFSRNSSVRSSSSSHSVNTVEHLSSQFKSVSGKFSTDEEGIGTPQTDNWSAGVHNVGLDKNVELPRISDTSTITNVLKESDSFEVPADSSENISTEPDKQTDLIDAFLRSSIGSKDFGRQEHLNGTHENRKPEIYSGLDKRIVGGDSRKGSFGYTKDNDSDSEHDGEHISLGRGIEPVNVKTDHHLPKENSGHSEPNSFDSTNGEGKQGDKMTAVVGEVSSFSIHKKVTTREESFGTHSETSVTSDSHRDNMSPRHSQSGAPEMYLIADKRGDYYALQEVDDVSDGSSVVTDNVNLHVVDMARTDGHGRTRNDRSSTHHDHYPTEGGITDVYIDSSAVDDDKARELISAYLDSQELNKHPNKTARDINTYQGNSTQQLYSHTNFNEDLTQRGADQYTGNSFVVNSGVPGTLEFLSSTHTGSIVIQQNGHSGVTGSTTHSDNHASSRGFINSSTYQHDDRTNNFADTSYMSNTSRFEQLNTSTGDQGIYTSSYNINRLGAPLVQGSPSSVVDSGYVTRRSGDYQSDSANRIVSQSGVNPFQPTPLTITTTTQAVVGEQVGMRIDYPPNGASDAFPSSSDDESNHKRYIVKNVQQKSSLKKTSNYEPRNSSDSNTEDVFTPGGIRTTQYNTIGTSRDIVQPNDYNTRHAMSFNGSDSMSPRSAADESVYRVYQSPTANHSLPRSSNEYNRSYVQENFVSSREDNSLYKVRSLSTSVPDGLQNVGEHRGRSGRRSPNYADIKRASKGVRKPHSPERIFKNAKLSLRKDDYDNDYYSDEETGNRQYRTVTKVYLNENKPRSRSPSPDAHYKLSSVQTSYEKKHDLDETDSGYQEHQRKYVVVGTSDNSEDRHVVNAHSSPRLDRKLTKSFEEATITRTESLQPSRLNNEPPSTKTHKTVIHLDAAEDATKDRRRSEDVDSLYMIKQAKSGDDLHRESRSVLTMGSQEQSMWRTGKVLSRSNSEDEEVDRQQASIYATSPRVVKTLKQEDGGKLYVVNSTVPREPDRSLNHPDGWYKSTIDINQNRPDKAQSVDDLLSHRIHEGRFDSHNFKTEKSMYFVREAAPQTNSRNIRGHHSTEFAYPDSGTGTEVTSSDGENEVRQRFERVERIYEVRSQPDLPEQFHSMEDLSNDLRVLRGNILIKNRLNDTDHGGDDFDENVNLFDNTFHLGKDNPLFSSDPDIMASLQREEEQALASHVHQDITFETVDKIAHEFREERQVQTKQPAARKKQNLSQLLLSKLANVDSKDIRQTIDVEHHNEEIYGDIDFIHADGERKTSTNTSNFDSVNEKVELTLTQGKAYVIIKVIAERIVPTDYEFNVWRKSQAIVTRQIEIDLLANEQRRRLYKHVMASAGTAGSLEDGSRSHYYDSQVLSPQERQLSSIETLKLFSQILDVAEGQGDKDYTETQTRQEMGQLPAAGMDLLY